MDKQNNGVELENKGAVRQAEVDRKTNETNIQLAFNVDGTGQSTIETDVPFLNHMLDLFTKHGQFDLNVQARGDIDIDDHHTVEDIGICLGQRCGKRWVTNAGLSVTPVFLSRWTRHSLRLLLM